MPLQHRFAKPLVLLGASAVSLLLAGCAAGPTRGPNGSPLPDIRTGNWQVSSSAAAAIRLPAISGSLQGSTAALTGTFHSKSQIACVAPTAAFSVSGKADHTGLITLTGPVAGGTLTITGTLAADGQSLSNATYNVSGGACAFLATVSAQAQAYMPISGAYTGTYRDGDGQIATVQATLNQSADANGDGNYTLTGTAAPNNPCFSPSVPISATTVSGGNFTFTYTDPNTNNSVTATGLFSGDASTLTVTGWTSSGSCGSDNGTGTMTHQ